MLFVIARPRARDFSSAARLAAAAREPTSCSAQDALHSHCTPASPSFSRVRLYHASIIRAPGLQVRKLSARAHIHPPTRLAVVRVCSAPFSSSRA